MDGETSDRNLTVHHGRRKRGRGEGAAPRFCAGGQSPVQTFKLSPVRSLKSQNNSRGRRIGHPPYAGILKFRRPS